MKRLLAGTLVVLLAVGVAWPASGASTATLAKKALALAGKANKTANRANKRAGQALGVARAGLKTVTAESGDVPAAPNDFAEFDVKCPSGFTPTGFAAGLGALELVAALAVPNGYLGSYFNPSSTTVYKGSLDVICVRGEWVGNAKPRLSRREAIDRLGSLKRAKKEQHR